VLHRGDDCALDMLDGDPDLEDGGDTESNGDEADFSGYAEELLTCHWSGGWDGAGSPHDPRFSSRIAACGRVCRHAKPARNL